MERAAAKERKMDALGAGLGGLLGLAFGVLVGWLLGDRRARGQSVVRLDRTKQELGDERIAREVADAKLQAHLDSTEQNEARFQQLANVALEKSQKQLLTLAEQKLGGTVKLSDEKLKSLVQPLADSLKKMEAATQTMEQKRAGAYQELRVQVGSLLQETVALRDSSAKLSTALRGSIQARGKWGQIALENIARSADMTEHCDFETEKTLVSGAGGARVDMLVKLPGGGHIPVDAKVPGANYLDALDCHDPVARAELMKAHAKDLRKHVDDLAQRKYSEKIEGVDFTVMFIPAEPILGAAFEADPGLQDYAFEKRVLVVTPVTLIALLRTVGLYWQQQTLAENAKEIYNQSKELYSRTAVFSEYLTKVGNGLRTAVNHFNSAVGSFERRVVPAGRKLEKLKITDGSKTITAPPLVEEDVRTVTSPGGSDQDG